MRMDRKICVVFKPGTPWPFSGLQQWGAVSKACRAAVAVAAAAAGGQALAALSPSGAAHGALPNLPFHLSGRGVRPGGAQREQRCP